MKHTKRLFNDTNQTEFFGLVWLTRETHPHRLRSGDVIRFDNRLCRVLPVTDCSAVVVMNQPPRQFETRFRGPVTFQPSPKMFRISPNSEGQILNRKCK
jgi:hypothetical protein